MVIPRLDLAGRSLAELHERAIQLWIEVATRFPEQNPAFAVFFALTDQSWPAGVPVVKDAIELCSVLNEVFGAPPLSEDEKAALSVRALELLRQHSRGLGPVQLMAYLKWANLGAYALGVLALLVSGLSWWVLGLAFAVWSCFGAARTAGRMRNRGVPRPSWELPALSAMHLVTLGGLYVAALLHLLR